MKKIQALALACSICIAGKAQITALNPTIQGGFELGNTFSVNGWTVVNPATLTDNRWIVSGVTPHNGTMGAHISNNDAAWAYTTTAARTCHFFKDIAIPTGAVSINLSFYWKGSGQVGNDRMLVYTGPTSVVPLVNQPISPASALPGATLQWTQSTTSGTYSLVNLPLSSSLAGTTVRVIFTWQNDASGGTSPGAAVDNISLTYVCGTPAAITGVAPLCPGTIVPLSNIFSGGSWASSNSAVGTISPSGVLTGIAAGSTTITYTSGSCVSTAVVSVSPLPAPITGSDTVCLGGTTTFANSVLGGTWSSSYPAVASVLSSSGVITGHAVGASFITYTMPGGCNKVDTAFVVNVPSAITGPTAVCPGSNITMACTPAGGVWSSMNPGSASIDPASGMVTGIAADTAVIKYASPVGGCPAYITITINPLPAPIISRSVMCAQGLDTAYNATVGGTWSSLTPSLATISSSGYVSPTGTAGIAMIKYTLATSCGVTKQITLNALPTPVITFDGPNNTMFTDTTYVTYQWYHSIFGEIPGADIFKVAGTFNGNYYVIVTNENGCSGQSAMFPYNSSMAGVNGITGIANVTIFPNPTTDVINITASAAVKVQLSGIDGKVLMSRNGAGQLFIGALPQGTYIVSAYDAEGNKLASKSVTKL